MTKMIFVNLPVADVARATAFYEAIGFTQDPRFSNAMASSMQWSDSIVFMLLGHDFFRTFTPKPIADEHQATAHLLCLSMDDRVAVDAITAKAAAAGGTADVRPAQDHSFMYGRTFADPDGHIIEPMWMDVAAFEAAQQPQAQAA